jgi:hypothetical protein
MSETSTNNSPENKSMRSDDADLPEHSRLSFDLDVDIAVIGAPHHQVPVRTLVVHASPSVEQIEIALRDDALRQH